MFARHFPPQPTIRRATPEDIRAGRAVGRNDVAERAPYAKTAPGVPAFGPADELFVIDDPDYEPHDYVESMIWPADAARALCQICRGTHTET